jgi:hypothetical protein
VIRRGFWLAAGAVTGIYGYRRVSAAGRRLSASLNPAEPAAALPQSARSARSAQLARRGRRGAIGLARETYRFTRDVREGMGLYMARHSEPPDSTLNVNHDPRPKDGH